MRRHLRTPWRKQISHSGGVAMPLPMNVLKTIFTNPKAAARFVLWVMSHVEFNRDI